MFWVLKRTVSLTTQTICFGLEIRKTFFVTHSERSASKIEFLRQEGYVMMALDSSPESLLDVILFVLFDLILYVPSTIFQV